MPSAGVCGNIAQVAGKKRKSIFMLEAGIDAAMVSFIQKETTTESGDLLVPL